MSYLNGSPVEMRVDRRVLYHFAKSVLRLLLECGPIDEFSDAISD